MNVALLDHGADWHAERAKGIGGSDAKRIMEGDWHALWMEKTGRQEPDDLSDVLQVQLGSFTELFNRAWFEKQTGIPVGTDGCEHLTHALHDFMRANLDGLCDGAAWEGKHVSAFSKDEEIVSRYYPQCQHILAVAGLPLIYLSVIFGNHKWAYFSIEADDAYQDDLIAREEEFWSYVTNDHEPPRTVEGVKTEIALDDMREVDLTGSNEWASHAGEWLDTKDAAKRFKAAEKSIKELVPDDANLAFGHGIKVTRSKAGALSIKEQK